MPPPPWEAWSAEGNALAPIVARPGWRSILFPPVRGRERALGELAGARVVVEVDDLGEAGFDGGGFGAARCSAGEAAYERWAGGGVRAVSYTHLRAHET